MVMLDEFGGLLDTSKTSFGGQLQYLHRFALPFSLGNVSGTAKFVTEFTHLNLEHRLLNVVFPPSIW
jgi:hypothetical protein